MTDSQHRRILGVLLAALAALLATSGLAPAHAKAKAPQLSIAVDDGRDDAKAGDELRYTVTVTNLGSERVRDLRITQTLPAGARIGKADRDGRASRGTVAWTVDIAAGKSTTLTASLVLARELPNELLRFATVVCAATSAKAAPTVCASDSNELPAGAAAAAQQRELEAAPSTTRPAWVLPAGLGSAALLLAAGLGAWSTRRRAARTAPGRRTDRG